MYKFAGYLIIVFSSLFTLISLAFIAENLVVSLLGTVFGSLFIWFGFWTKKQSVEGVARKTKKWSKDLESWSKKPYTFGEETLVKEMHKLYGEDVKKAEDFVNKYSIKNRFPGLRKAFENRLEDDRAKKAKENEEARLLREHQRQQEEKRIEEAKIREQEEKEEKLKREQERHEKKLKLVEDLKRYISDETELEKVSQAFLKGKHCMGMPREHLTFIYGRIYDQKETVSKKGETVKGKYIKTGTNQLGNTTYKYEMTFEDSILVGWKEL